MIISILFYYIYRIYQSEKRKEEAPLEILMGEKLEDGWVELLYQVIQGEDFEQETDQISSFIEEINTVNSLEKKEKVKSSNLNKTVTHSEETEDNNYPIAA